MADFSRLDDVRRLADAILARHGRIDVLANTAGGIFSRQMFTVDGHEMTFQVNYLAPFVLTRLLLDRLAEAPEARVIFTGSVMYRKGRIDLDDLNSTHGRYRSMAAYGASKLAILLFTRELARRTRGTGVIASAFHAGVVASDAMRDNPSMHALMRSPLARVFLKTPEQGAEPLIRLATMPDPQSVGGVYFHRLKPEEQRNTQATDTELARRLWERSEQLTGVVAGGWVSVKADPPMNEHQRLR